MLYSFINSLEETISKTALRKVFRETNANCEIEEFFDKIS
jgi:ADP-ribose pyrophosphatase YjhB (NUDIX family)